MSLIKTPHAAVIVWNYEERLTAGGAGGSGLANPANSITTINEIIISTISLMSISINKSKSEPTGSFNLVLAPTRNWTATLTSGSWCAILMSNDPLDENSFKEAKATQLKMIGRIDAVRTNVSVDDSGTRSTTYSVQGRDWGSIFENTIYIDPIIQDPSELGETQANSLYQQLAQAVYNDNNSPNTLAVPKQLTKILSVLGHPLRFPETERMFKATHEVSLPDGVVNFLLRKNLSQAEKQKQLDESNSPEHANESLVRTWKPELLDRQMAPSTKFMDLLTFIWGPLKDNGEDTYHNADEYLTQSGTCYLNPGDFLGQHTIWSVLQENCNYAMNDLFTELRWKGDYPEFRLYCRIKPFAYKDVAVSDKVDTAMRSKFQNIASHLLDTDAVINVSAGVNWADKFNFIEIKPALNELSVLGVTLKDKSQVFQGTYSTSNVFDREGFRPLFFSIKQLPFRIDGESRPIDGSLLQQWVLLAQEWYFDSHKFLNGTINLHGTNEYIPVGDNIMFDAGLIGTTSNYNENSISSKNPIYVLAHVESTQYDFSVGSDGARTYRTTINFVRGILVNKQKQLIGTGTIDNLASALSKEKSKNSLSVFSSEEE